MKYFEPTYLVLLAGSLVRWLVSTKDLFSDLAAIVLGTMTIVYMYYKIKDMILSVKIKRKNLEQ